jgi:hypothetical protein
LFVFAGLLVVAYFVVTSSAFFKGVILPRAGKAVGSQITVADASISPFSQVHLPQLKVQTTGTEPLLQAEEVRLRYSPFSILGGTIKVDELSWCRRSPTRFRLPTADNAKAQFLNKPDTDN